MEAAVKLPPVDVTRTFRRLLSLPVVAVIVI